LTQSEAILPSIHQEIGRLKTIHHLTGGNPRTSVMLFRLIAKGFSKELNDDLEALLDEITPLYKARFEALSDSQQKIVDAIALHWDPINLGDLRAATRLENNQISPQLKRLREVGWIEALDAYQAKGKAYQISERFFNIWFLMRRSSRRQKRELLCLSKFLESFYGERLSGIAEGRLGLRASTANHVAFNLAIAEVLKDEGLKDKLREKSYRDLVRLAEDNPDILNQFDIDNLIEQKINITIALKKENKELEIENKALEKENKELKKYLDLIENNKFSEGEILLKKLLNIRISANTLSILGDLYKSGLKQFGKAESTYLKATKINNKDAYPWNQLGNLYQDYLKQYQKAEQAFIKSLTIEKNYYPAKHNLIFLYRDKLQKLEKAKKIFEEIKFEQSIKDSYYLHFSLFTLYEKNEGNAKHDLLKALSVIGQELPPHSQNDWFRFAAVTTKLGYNQWLQDILKEQGYDVILAPYFVAIKALNEKDEIGYLNSKAVEIREPAKKIIEMIKRYMD